MQIQTITTTEAFLKLRDQWNALLAGSVSNCVFLTHEWLSTWWKHLAHGRSLAVLAAREGEELIGILPLVERCAQYARMMPRVLEFLGGGSVGSDYLDAIVAPGREREVMGAFAEHLHETGRMIQLGQLRRENCIVSGLVGHLSEKHWRADHAGVNVCPYIDLRAHSWESYLATLSHQVRKSIKRCLRSLPRDFEYQLRCVQTRDEAGPALNTLIDLHGKRWAGRGRSEAFQSDPVIAFHREFVESAAERGWLRLLIIDLNSQPAAALYGLHYGPAFSFYQSGFDPAFSKYSVGMAVMAVAIQTAIAEGSSEYDFLHGNEEYKFHWTRQTRDLGRIELHPPRTRARIYRHAMGFNRAARRMARQVLARASNVALSR
jgi:CelD/BcsL family acetyltransferase involved in cellulose biosynthesis